MAVRFAPPPAWPVPPGFTPTTDWHPDPSWPPAPPGWVFWVDDAAAPAVDDPAHAVVSSTMVLPTLPPAAAAPSTTAGLGPLALPSVDDDVDEHAGSARRWVVPSVVGLAGVAVGLLVGIGLTLSAQADAEEATAAAERVQAEVAAEREQLEAERADLEAQREQVDAAQAGLTEREATVAQAEEDLATRTQELDERAAEQERRDQEQPDDGGQGGSGEGGGDQGGGDQGEDQDDGWGWGDWGGWG